MGDNQGYKQYINYFKKWDGAAMLGGIMMVVGFLLLWLGRGFVSYIFMIIGLVFGLGIFLYGSIGRKHEADFQSEIEHHAEKITFRELEEDPQFRYRVPKGTIEERVFEGFDLHEGLYIKQMKNAALCSSEYTYAKMLFLNDGFYIKRLCFSFVSDRKELSVFDIPYHTLEDISIQRERKTTTTINGKKLLVKTCFLCLTYHEGEKLLLPCKDDIYADEFVEDIKRKYMQPKG